MKRSVIIILFAINCLRSPAQFAPPAGQAGSTAIYKDSSAFVAWATGCTVTRGYQDISNTSLGYASSGDSAMALGKAGVNATVSLGDGGIAILTFGSPIKNASGWDFAIFENSFSDTYLELAFVEVSSDGINYFRFPATSNTQDTIQVGGFGSVDATKINNMAGKYRALYGTPFDLQELSSDSGLNINNITHVKIIDVVGCIQNAYARYDKNNHKINDPWNTPFASSGFDLDAVGVINQAMGIKNYPAAISQCSLFPNPVDDNSILQYYLNKPLNVKISIIDLLGKEIIVLADEQQGAGWQMFPLNGMKLNRGIYCIYLTTVDGTTIKKIIAGND